MGQLLIRNVEDEMTARLKRQAARHGRSMEEEARDILRDGLKDDEQPAEHEEPEGGTRHRNRRAVPRARAEEGRHQGAARRDDQEPV